MKRTCTILAVALLSPYMVPNANAEGPLHWTARHVTDAAVDTGHTMSNVARTASRTIYHRTRPIRQAFK
jgi:hypothetical protein